MNRNYILLLGVLSFHLCFTECMAQDTLFYKKGNLAIGSIVDIDSANGKLAFQVEESIRVVLFTSLRSIGLDDKKYLNNNFFNVHEDVLVQAPKSEINSQGLFLLGEAKYNYSKWLIQFDLFSPLIKESETYPYNSSIGIGIEYFFSDRLSISLLGRLGTAMMTFSTDTIDANSYYSLPYIAEMKHEFEISMRFYPFNQRKFTPYFTPCINFGKFIYYHQKDFNRVVESGQDYFYSYSVLLDQRSGNYFEWGGAAGILLNITRSINLSAQLIFVSTNATRTSSEYYQDYNNSGYQRLYTFDDRYRQANVRFQVFIVCRFGGKLKESAP